MARKSTTKKNTRQVLAIQKKIDKTKDILKSLVDKLQTMKEESEAPEPQLAQAEPTTTS